MIKIWSSAVADRKFGDEVKKRDKKCVLCKRKPPEVVLTCSHFWGRYASATRYDFENADAICFGCHFKIENAKQGIYREFKMKQLGPEKYKALEKRYYQEKTTRRDEILKLMEWLKTLDNS